MSGARTFAFAVAVAFAVAFAVAPAAPAAPAAPVPLLEDGARLRLAVSADGPAPVRVDVAAGELVRIRVDQIDVDVAIDTVGPDGAAGISFDSPVNPGGPDRVYLLGEPAGLYRLAVRGFQAGDAGQVVLEIEERRPVDESARLRMRAEAVFAEGRRLRGSGGPALRGEARSRFEEALALYRRLEDPWRMADCLTYAGGLDLADRRAADSIPRHREALGLLDETGQRRRAALTLVNLAWAFDNLADYQAALDAYDRALRRFDELGLTGGRATVLAGRGRIEHALGAYERAVASHRAALDAWSEAHREYGEAISWSNIGRALDAAGDLAGAEQAFRDAWARADAVPGRRAGQIALRLGRVLRRQGRAAEAADWIARAEERYESAGDPRGLAAARLERGELALANPERECSDFEGAREAFARMEDPAGEAAALHGVARCLDGRDDRAGALAAVRGAVERLESLRADVREDALRATFLASRKASYDLLLRLLFESAAATSDLPHRGAILREAFGAAERARARALLDALREAGVAGDPGPWTRPIDLDAARAGLAPGEALVSWSLAGANTYVFTVTRDTFDARELGTAPAVLDERVAGYVELLSERAGESWRPVGRRLSRELLDPLRELDPEIRRLVLVPDGALHRLPFEALPLAPEGPPGGARVLERFEVTYAPSATVHRLLAARGRGDDVGGVWVFGAPPVRADGTDAAAVRGLSLYAAEGLVPGPLPHAAREAREVAAIAGELGRLWVGAEATEARLKAAGTDAAGVLHLATHGLVSHRSAARSALLLAPSAAGADGTAGEDGFLQTGEICRLRLRDPLVVLSACESARGPLIAGEGVQGLARGFLYAGARAVVATLWNVGDEATADFMRRFYRQLAAGDAPAAALREAKLGMLETEAGAAPRLWAAYVVIGDGAAPVRLGAGALERADAAAAAADRPGALAWFGGGALLLLALALGAGAWLARRRPSAAARPGGTPC